MVGVALFLTLSLPFNPNPNPNQAFLHPSATVDALAALLPSGFAAPLAIIRNWTYARLHVAEEGEDHGARHGHRAWWGGWG